MSRLIYFLGGVCINTTFEQAELMLRESENEEEDDTDEDVEEIERDVVKMEEEEEVESKSKNWNASAFSNPSVKKTQSLNCKRPDVKQHTPSNTPLSRYVILQSVFLSRLVRWIWK